MQKSGREAAPRSVKHLSCRCVIPVGASSGLGRKFDQDVHALRGVHLKVPVMQAFVEACDEGS